MPGETTRCGFSIRYVAVRSTVFKTGRRRRGRRCAGGVISRTANGDLQQVHLATDVSGAAGSAHLLCGRYRAVMLWIIAIRGAYK